MADWPPDVGDLVRVIAPGHDPPGPALVVEKDQGGWLRLKWGLGEPEGYDGYDRWYPPAKLIMISRACKKDGDQALSLAIDAWQDLAEAARPKLENL